MLITEKKKVIEINKEFVRQTKAWETWEVQESWQEVGCKLIRQFF